MKKGFWQPRQKLKIHLNFKNKSFETVKLNARQDLSTQKNLNELIMSHFLQTLPTHFHRAATCASSCVYTLRCSERPQLDVGVGKRVGVISSFAVCKIWSVYDYDDDCDLGALTDIYVIRCSVG